MMKISQTPEICKELYFQANWPAPRQVKALTTTRIGQINQGPYGGFNLSYDVGDNSGLVTMAREKLSLDWEWEISPQWLVQKHDNRVIKAQGGIQGIEADAVWTDELGQPCIVMTADCLPVFFCNRQGTKVALAHAGWRGLASGVLANTLAALAASPEDILIWMGPAISQAHFEVGDEVREIFLRQNKQNSKAFLPAKEPGKWFADLYQIARLQLNRSGVKEIYASSCCTYAKEQYFYSYRRAPQTGRMANIIWLESLF